MALIVHTRPRMSDDLNARGVVLVTGATGNVGREVVRALVARGMCVRAATRGLAKTTEGSAGVATVRLDFADPTTFDAADGVRAVFLVRPPAISDTKHTLVPFIDEARRRGVEQVVFLSVAGAAHNILVPHHAVERHLAPTRGWTILRPGFFAQNLEDAYRRDIIEDARIYVPAGRGRVAFVDVRDIAELAATVFESAGSHDRQAYTLTGSEAIGFTETAAHLSEAIGRVIRYQPASIVGYLAHLRQRGAPWAQAGVQAVLHAGLRFGQAERVDPTLAQLLGRPPRNMRQYVQDRRAVWLPS